MRVGMKKFMKLRYHNMVQVLLCTVFQVITSIRDNKHVKVREKFVRKINSWVSVQYVLWNWVWHFCDNSYNESVCK